MELSKQVYRNKLNGELYREMIGFKPRNFTFNTEATKLFKDGARFFLNVENQRDMRIATDEDIATNMEEVNNSVTGGGIMYEVKDPKFVIKVGFDRNILLSDAEHSLEALRIQLADAFYAKFRGIRFKVKLVNERPEVYYFIYFPNPPHKTVIKKMLAWIKRNYRVIELDISEV